MDRKKVLYLGGRINCLTFKQATNTRNYVKARLGEVFVVVDPMRGKAMEPDDAILPQYRGGFTDAELRARDKMDLLHSDILIHLTWDEVTLGSMMEAGAAFWLGKPIIALVSDLDAMTGHPYESVPEHIFEDVDELCDHMLALWV